MPRNWAYGKHRKSGYRSGLEEQVAQTLKEKGVTFLYEPKKLQYSKNVSKGYCPSCGSKKVVKLSTYTPDFYLENGTYIEVKGRLTASDRTKLIAVRASNPDIKLVLYFKTNNKLSRKSETRYEDWATKNKFDYSIGSIPRRWLSTTSS